MLRVFSTGRSMNAVSRGFTLLEVLIATAIIATAMGIALGAISGLAGMSKTIDRKNELVSESISIFNSINNELSLSGWATYDVTPAEFASSSSVDRSLRYYPYVIQQAGGLQGASVTWFQSSSDNWFARNTSLIDLARFVKRPDLPPLNGVPPNGLPADFSQSYDSTSFASAEAREKAYRASFFARSQELIFLRSTVGGWPAKPGIDTTPILKFPEGDWTSATKDVGGGVYVKDNHLNLGVIRMEEWKLGDANPVVAAPIDIREPTTFYWNRPTAPAGLKKIPAAVNLGVLLSPQADPGNLVQVRWESMVDPAASQINRSLADPHPVVEAVPASGGIIRVKAPQLREYAYVLVPSATGAGRLVRAHSELVDAPLVTGSAPWYGDCIGKGKDPNGRNISLIIDQVLTENCMRVVFDTYRSVTDASLQPNQIRVTLYLAAGGVRPSEVPTTYMTSSVLTMRVLNSSVDNDSITAALGTTSPGLAH